MLICKFVTFLFKVALKNALSLSKAQKSPFTYSGLSYDKFKVSQLIHFAKRYIPPNMAAALQIPLRNLGTTV